MCHMGRSRWGTCISLTCLFAWQDLYTCASHPLILICHPRSSNYASCQQCSLDNLEWAGKKMNATVYLDSMSWHINRRSLSEQLDITTPLPRSYNYARDFTKRNFTPKNDDVTHSEWISLQDEISQMRHSLQFPNNVHQVTQIIVRQVKWQKLWPLEEKMSNSYLLKLAMSANWTV